jgi:hypothetical protein
MLTLIQGFLKGGLDTSGLRIRELPRILLTPPTAASLNDPNTVTVNWGMTWKRWDGLTYTTDAGYSSFTEDTNTSHVVIYSKDSGGTWFYASDNTPATLGIRPTVASRWAYQAVVPSTSSFTYSWDVSNRTNFPEGNYLVRVEAYRDTLPLHYGFHQMKIFIKRP